MQGKSIYKVPKGKMVKVYLRHFNDRIDMIKITGDFFIHPEDAIILLEEQLIGQKLTENDLINFLRKVKKKNNLTFFGVDEDSFAKAIIMAKENIIH